MLPQILSFVWDVWTESVWILVNFSSFRHLHKKIFGLQVDNAL